MSSQLGTLTIKELIERITEDDFQAAIRKEYQELLTLEDFNTYYNFKKPENQHKNHHQNIPCADFSRVSIKGDKNTYIHANYVPDFNLQHYIGGFIATQAPMPTTLDDFWQMVWLENSKMIIMLLEFEYPHYVLYWNLIIGDHLTVGKFKIATIFCSNKEYYMYTKLKITNQETMEVREVHHFYYEEWPNYGVPKNFKNFLTFVNVIRTTRKSLYQNVLFDDPVIVHCSDGVGRTGTFCAIMNSIESIEQTNRVNMFEIVEEIRDHRPFSVAVEEQYLYCYKILAYYIYARFKFMPTFSL